MSKNKTNHAAPAVTPEVLTPTPSTKPVDADSLLADLQNSFTGMGQTSGPGEAAVGHDFGGVPTTGVVTAAEPALKPEMLVIAPATVPEPTTKRFSTVIDNAPPAAEPAPTPAPAPGDEVRKARTTRPQDEVNKELRQNFFSERMDNVAVAGAEVCAPGPKLSVRTLAEMKRGCEAIADR